MCFICYEAVWCVISVWKLGRISPTCYARGLSDCYMFITLSWKSLLFFQLRASPGILSANVSCSPDVWRWISQLFVCVDSHCLQFSNLNHLKAVLSVALKTISQPKAIITLQFVHTTIQHGQSCLSFKLCF